MNYRYLLYACCLTIIAGFFCFFNLRYERTYTVIEGLPSGPIGDELRKKIDPKYNPQGDHTTSRNVTFFGFVIEEETGIGTDRPEHRGLPGGLITFALLMFSICLIIAAVPTLIFKRLHREDYRLQAIASKIHERMV